MFRTVCLQINVNVTYAGPDQGCVVVATQPLKRGDLLAAIPVDLCWSIATDGGNGTMEVRLQHLINAAAGLSTNGNNTEQH